MKKNIALAIAAVAITANAVAAQPNRTLDIALLKDGHPILAGTHAIHDPFRSSTPFTYYTGDQVPYGACQITGNTRTTSVHQRFVGRSVVLIPKSEDASGITLLASVSDTGLVKVRDAGTADCPTQVVDTSGLDQSSIPVTIKDGATIDVPLSNSHYQLRLTLRAE